MSHGQESKPPGIAPIATGLNAFVQAADGFLEPAGAVQRSAEGVEKVASLSPNPRMNSQVGLYQADQGLVIGDGIGGEHTGPHEAVDLYEIRRVADPLKEIFAGAP